MQIKIKDPLVSLENIILKEIIKLLITYNIDISKYQYYILGPDPHHNCVLFLSNINTAPYIAQSTNYYVSTYCSQLSTNLVTCGNQREIIVSWFKSLNTKTSMSIENYLIYTQQTIIYGIYYGEYNA